MKSYTAVVGAFAIMYKGGCCTATSVSPPKTAHKNGKHVRIRGISCGSYLKTCKGKKNVHLAAAGE